MVSLRLSRRADRQPLSAGVTVPSDGRKRRLRRKLRLMPSDAERVGGLDADPRFQVSVMDVRVLERMAAEQYSYGCDWRCCDCDCDCSRADVVFDCCVHDEPLASGRGSSLVAFFLLGGRMKERERGVGTMMAGENCRSGTAVAEGYEHVG